MSSAVAIDQAQLESQLNHFDLPTRQAALQELAEAAQAGAISVAPLGDRHNLHCHSFCSYNGYGLSPSGVVWAARKLGLSHVGLVDFDVFDGVDEFHAAGRALGIRTVAGMETRAFLPEFATRELNSPGEPGITYHMVCGLTQTAVPAAQAPFLADLRARAQSRNLALLEKVNAFLAPVQLNYEADLLPLTPYGVPTERHICQAYQEKAATVFTDATKRAAFWSEKLGQDVSAFVDNGPKLQGLIRSKTIKKGGVGYQQPGPDSFPAMDAINVFALGLGAMPCMTWLDGTSAGEGALEELMDREAKTGVCMLNIVPDRNWNIADAATKARKVAELHKVVAAADARGWPIIAGTELNAPGLKFVDDFHVPEMAPVADSFRRGAEILFGHSVAVAQCKPGYTSEWAKTAFASVFARNECFARLGRSVAVLP